MAYRAPTLTPPVRPPRPPRPRGWWVHAGFLVALALPLVSLWRVVAAPRRCLGDGCGMGEAILGIYLLVMVGCWAIYAVATTVAVACGERRAAPVAVMHLTWIAVVLMSGVFLALMSRY